MNQALELELDDGRTAFKPQDTISGTASWALTKPPKTIEVALLWFTRGKGTQDVQTVDSVSFDNVGEMGSEKFSFCLPKEPYSFSGQLITLTWAIECIAEPSGEGVRKEIVVSPSQSEIRLEKAAESDWPSVWIRSASTPLGKQSGSFGGQRVVWTRSNPGLLRKTPR